MIYTVDTYDWHRIHDAGVQRPGRGTRPRSRKRQYVNLVTAFDIETTTLMVDHMPQGVMYIWQWAFGPDVVVGRTWEEYKTALARIKAELPSGSWLAVWVHNLSYEWHYLRGVVEFGDVFATEARRILRADVDDWMELRCSYLHSGYSLDEWLDSLKVEHTKLDLDYSVQRFPWTDLSEDELAYCVNDVLGLVEAIQIEMDRDGDTLSSIPPTSTGYIRRELKRAISESVPRGRMMDMQPDWGCYQLLRDAFRGGNTHASRYYAGRVIHNVGHIDRSSSYPDVLCHHKYPVGRWQHVTCGDLTDIARNLVSGYAMVIRLQCWDVRLRKPLLTGCPYISKDWCVDICGDRMRKLDNGRVLEANYLELACTDIDLKIILDQYTFKPVVVEYYKSKYGWLPEPVTDILKKYYIIKTELKGVEGREAEYDHSKRLINGAFGCCAQDPGKPLIQYSETYDDLFELDTSKTRQERFERQRRKGFLPYSIGVWCTSWARMELELLITHVGLDFIYCDTDSVFYANPGNYTDWTWYNNPRLKAASASGACAQDSKGRWHYMGTAEPEPNCTVFATLGAKKYCEIDETGKYAGKLRITIAGVNKDKGSVELEKKGGIERFCAAWKERFKFTESGKLAAVYNDAADFNLVLDGHPLHIGPNVCLVETTYTLKVAGDYYEILEELENLAMRYRSIDTYRLSML